MSNNRQYSGNPYQIPVKLTNRPTTADTSRPRLPRLDQDDENPDAWTMPKPHTSSIKRTAYLDTRNPKKTKRVRQRTFDRSTLMIVLGLALIVMIVGWFVFSLIANWWTNTTED